MNDAQAKAVRRAIRQSSLIHAALCCFMVAVVLLINWLVLLALSLADNRGLQ